MPIQNDRFIKNGNITTTTYQGMLDLISSSRLIPGDNYLISDYQTIRLLIICPILIHLN